MSGRFKSAINTELNQNNGISTGVVDIAAITNQYSMTFSQARMSAMSVLPFGSANQVI
jgi:hypothetical protein